MTCLLYSFVENQIIKFHQYQHNFTLLALEMSTEPWTDQQLQDISKTDQTVLYICFEMKDTPFVIEQTLLFQAVIVCNELNDTLLVQLFRFLFSLIGIKQFQRVEENKELTFGAYYVPFYFIQYMENIHGYQSWKPVDDFYYLSFPIKENNQNNILSGYPFYLAGCNVNTEGNITKVIPSFKTEEVELDRAKFYL